MKLARRRYRMCFLVADEYRECQTFLCETPSSNQRKAESALLRSPQCTVDRKAPLLPREVCRRQTAEEPTHIPISPR
jgi:hypothetical protein